MKHTKLEEEYCALKASNLPIIVEVPAEEVFTHLNESPDVALKDAIDSEKKTLKRCLQYVLNRVRDLLGNRPGYVNDNVVYDYAEEYYLNPLSEFLPNEETSESSVHHLNANQQTERVYPQKKQVYPQEEQQSLF